MENSYLNPNHDVFTRYKYLGNFIYENGRLDKVMFDGGYIKINSFNITLETLPNGNVIYYEYDASGRLACKKDRNGKVIQQYGYNYKNR